MVANGRARAGNCVFQLSIWSGWFAKQLIQRKEGNENISKCPGRKVWALSKETLGMNYCLSFRHPHLSAPSCTKAQLPVHIFQDSSHLAFLMLPSSRHCSCPAPQEPLIVGTCHDHCKSVCLWASMLPRRSTLVAAMVFLPFHSVFTGISPCYKAPDSPA